MRSKFRMLTIMVTTIVMIFVFAGCGNSAKSVKPSTRKTFTPCLQSCNGKAAPILNAVSCRSGQNILIVLKFSIKLSPHGKNTTI